MAPSRNTAILALLLACACWALSFPLGRALNLAQGQQIPGASSWFVSAWCLTLRFLISGLLVAAWCWWKGLWPGCTRTELSQAVGLGVFTASGMLLQLDGLAYTSASNSAFITQGYCVFLPLYFTFQQRRLPRWPLCLGSALILLGVGVLAQVDLRDLHLGRGEWETIGAALCFTVQILWVERPAYVDNHMGRVSALAFSLTGLLYLPILVFSMPHAQALLVYAQWPSAICLLLLTLICTLLGIGLMFAYQRGVDAISAAIIYGSEPMFASVYAFVLPGILSPLMGIDYPNETLTRHLLLGGLLVLTANLVVQWKPRNAAIIQPPASSTA